MSRILVVGAPRSGTTWVAKALGCTPDAVVVQEPDNPEANPHAIPAKREIGVYPVLAAGAEVPRQYQALWDLAFGGGWPTSAPMMSVSRLLRKLPRPVLHGILDGLAPAAARIRRPPRVMVVKSVMVPFALDWLVERYSPQVVVIERDPRSVVASWHEMGIPLDGVDRDDAVRRLVAEPLGIRPVDAGASMLARTAWMVGLMMTIQRIANRQHSEFHVVSHERLCRNTAPEFRHLFDALGLTWTDAVEFFLSSSNQPGSGYDTRRVAAELPGKWRTALSAEQAADIQRVLDGFPELTMDAVPA